MGIPPLTSNVQAAYKLQDDQLPDFDKFLQSAKGAQSDQAGRRADRHPDQRCADHDPGQRRADHFSQSRGNNLKIGPDNTIHAGPYVIHASVGTKGPELTVTDAMTGKTIDVFGDPHISDGTQTASFQHGPATFNLPGGVRITVFPTNNPGVNSIASVQITDGRSAVAINGFQTGNVQAEAELGEGRAINASIDHGIEISATQGLSELLSANGSPINGPLDA
jgi:Domain of Unknown Function (DUF1521)